MDGNKTVSTTLSFPWSRQNASRMFMMGNVLRLGSAAVLLYQACRYLERDTKQPELLFFGGLQILDMWFRYPLAVQETTEAATIIMFSIVWTIIVGIYAIPMVGTAASVGIVVLLIVVLGGLVTSTTSCRILKQTKETCKC